MKCWKILHSESSLGWGGQEKRILLSMDAARKRGSQVHLVCQPSSVLAGEAEAKGFPVYRVAMDPWFSPGTLFRLARFVRDERFDIVHTHSSGDSWALGVAVKFLVRSSCRIVRTRHLSTPVRGTFVYRCLTDAIMTTGESIKEYLIRKGVRPEKVLSVPTGVDMDMYSFSEAKRESFRKELGVDEKTVVIGNVAVLRSWKGHDDFLNIAKRVHAWYPNTQFVIVGDGEQRQRLENRVAQEGMTEYVRMLGYREDVARVLCGLDIFLFTSYANEGVPQAVSQAMAAARPVVATRVGSMEDVVVDGITGLLSDSRDVQGLAEKVAILVEDPGTSQRMGRAGYQRIVSRFTLEQMEERVWNVYRELFAQDGLTDDKQGLRIALVRQRVAPRGGAEGATYRLADEIAKAGYRVHVLANTWEDPLGDVVYHRMAMRGSIAWLKALSFQSSVREFLRKNRFDVVCGLDRTFPVDVYRAGDGSHRAWLQRVGPMLSLWRRLLLRMDPKNWVLLWLEKELFTHPRLRKVIANSDMVRRELMQLYKIPPEKIVTVHNGIELAKCIAPRNPEEKRMCKRLLGLDTNRTVLLFLGNNYERKGLQFLLQALADQRDRPITLLIAGKGREKKYRAFAAKHAISNKIRWMGFARNPEALYRAADLFVLPTLYDPFSNVCLEAMGYGLPVITTPSNGACEAFVDGKTGWIVLPQDTSKALAKALVADLWQMGRFALVQAENHTLAEQVQKTLETFLSICKEDSYSVSSRLPI